ncbi:RsmB/NOP family class I SAM-dependent RNA methyltransferase [Candidatus Woesearchaeota archaeon]|nr:RsmB/NOP family class I SAM-dependent RNA methyltransferase [Candidatus Woesearchaeota archaeon]
MEFKFKNNFIKKFSTITDFEKFKEFSLKYPRKAIRVNTIKITSKKLLERLSNQGFIFEEVKWCKDAFFVKHKDRKPVGNTLEHFLGYYYVQEAASLIPPLALDIKKEDLVLDLCASPGSKTTQIASLMENEGLIIANDITGTRIKPLVTNLQRCGVKNCIVTLMSGQSIKGSFDKILLDAPCSGTGAIRKSPETVIMWNENMVKRFVKVQKSLIINAFDVLKDNGILVYSTCSIDPDENERVVEFLLEKRSNAKIEKFDININRSEILSENSDVKNCLRIWPQDNDTEGFFIAKIRKTKLPILVGIQN